MRTKEGPASADTKGVEEWAPFGVAVPDYRFHVNCEDQVVDPMQEEAALTVGKAAPDRGTVVQTVLQAEHADAEVPREPETGAVKGNGGSLTAHDPFGDAPIRMGLLWRL